MVTTRTPGITVLADGRRFITVTHCGRICLGKRKIKLSTVFAGQNAGIKEVSDGVRVQTPPFLP
jgi:hypothetical protein